MEVVFEIAADITVMAQGAILASAARMYRGRRARARSLLGRLRTKTTSRKPSMLRLDDVHVHIGKLHLFRACI